MKAATDAWLSDTAMWRGVYSSTEVPLFTSISIVGVEDLVSWRRSGSKGQIL